MAATRNWYHSRIISLHVASLRSSPGDGCVISSAGMVYFDNTAQRDECEKAVIPAHELLFSCRKLFRVVSGRLGLLVTVPFVFTSRAASDRLMRATNYSAGSFAFICANNAAAARDAGFCHKIRQISAPASATFSKFTPVSIPMPCNM